MTDALSHLTAALADRYEIERELGAGGMATVFLAEDLKLHRKVALKVLRPELASALGPDRFLQEIDIAARLNHPHILGLFDCGEAAGFLYYVMPYVEGQSLREKLTKEGELPVAEAVRILRDVVDALSHAHRHNVVHRDIKPDNVMLSERHALVADFGVAKAVSDATGAVGLTTEGVALGTPAYMSPEQASADPHIDHRADIYAVGVIAYELLTGRTPFVGNTQQELVAAHVTQTPESVTKYRESVPPALAELVMKCLEKKAADRWQTAEELLTQLEALATPSGGVTPTGMVPLDRRLKQRWMMIGGAVAVAAVVAVIAVVASISGGSGVTLDPNHVVVAAFRNETGDPSLDHLGARAGHWITQGLQQAAIPITPWDNAVQSWEYVQGEAAAGRVTSPVRALAEETGAGVVVSGTVYLVGGDSVELQTNVTDAIRGRPLGTVEPVRDSRSSESSVISQVQQRVMTFLAVRFSDLLNDWAPNAIGDPPTYEAYQAFLDGQRHVMRREFADATAYFRRASELDSTWAAPLMRMRNALWNQQLYEEADSVVRVLEDMVDGLNPYEQAVVRFMRARTDGNSDSALAAIRIVAELAPGSPDHYNVALLANDRNRPREAFDVLSLFDAEHGWIRGAPFYWWEVTEALHKLGEHERELEAARQAYELHPDRGAYMLPKQAQALTALGRVEAAEELFDEIAAAPDLRTGGALVTPAEFLRLFGHGSAAQRFAGRAVSWFEARPPNQAMSQGVRRNHARALFVAGRPQESLRVLDSLVAEYPDDIEYRGVRGYVSVACGDSAQAVEDADWLAGIERPYLYGRQKFWHGAVIGALGDKDTAVRLLNQAFSEGQRLYSRIFVRFELDAVRDHPEFQELMRPKG